jgi:hypothetical protein
MGDCADPEEANQEMFRTVSEDSTSDGRRENAVPLAAESTYDFREPGVKPGKVG